MEKSFQLFIKTSGILHYFLNLKKKLFSFFTGKEDICLQRPLFGPEDGPSQAWLDRKELQIRLSLLYGGERRRRRNNTPEGVSKSD